LPKIILKIIIFSINLLYVSDYSISCTFEEDSYCGYVTIGDGWTLGGNKMFSGVSLDDNTYDNSSGIQSNLHYVTSQGNSEIWSNKAGGRLTQM